MTKKGIDTELSHVTHERFTNINRGPLVESDEDILRSKKGSNKIIALPIIALILAIILLISYFK